MIERDEKLQKRILSLSDLNSHRIVRLNQSASSLATGKKLFCLRNLRPDILLFINVDVVWRYFAKWRCGCSKTLRRVNFSKAVIIIMYRRLLRYNTQSVHFGNNSASCDIRLQYYCRMHCMLYILSAFWRNKWLWLQEGLCARIVLGWWSYRIVAFWIFMDT